MRELLEEYGAVVLTLVVVAGVIYGCIRIFCVAQKGGV